VGSDLGILFSQNGTVGATRRQVRYWTQSTLVQSIWLGVRSMEAGSMEEATRSPLEEAGSGHEGIPVTEQHTKKRTKCLQQLSCSFWCLLPMTRRPCVSLAFLLRHASDWNHSRGRIKPPRDPAWSKALR
jgi:hypothetical protein